MITTESNVGTCQRKNLRNIWGANSNVASELRIDRKIYFICKLRAK